MGAGRAIVIQWLPVRNLEIAALQRAFSEAAMAGRGGLVREVLTAQYPRMAQLLEDVITKLLQDTQVQTSSPLNRNSHSCAAVWSSRRVRLEVRRHVLPSQACNCVPAFRGRCLLCVKCHVVVGI